MTNAYEGTNVALAVVGEAIIDHLPELTASELKVFMVYALRFNGTAGSAFPGNDSVAEMTGLNRTTVQRARAGLVEKKLLSMEKPSDRRTPARFSVDECKRFSDIYRKKRGDSEGPHSDTPQDVGAAPSQPLTESGAAFPSHEGPHPRGPKEQPERTNSSSSESVPTDSRTEPPKPVEPEPLRGEEDGHSQNEIKGKPAFAAALGSWICSQANAAPPSRAQSEKFRAAVENWLPAHEAKLRDQGWCDTIRARAQDFASKSEKGLGLLAAFIAEAERDLAKDRSTGDLNTVSGNASTASTFDEADRANKLRKARGQIHSANLESEYAKEQLQAIEDGKATLGGFTKAEVSKAYKETLERNAREIKEAESEIARLEGS